MGQGAHQVFTGTSGLLLFSCNGLGRSLATYLSRPPANSPRRCWRCWPCRSNQGHTRRCCSTGLPHTSHRTSHMLWDPERHRHRTAQHTTPHRRGSTTGHHGVDMTLHDAVSHGVKQCAANGWCVFLQLHVAYRRDRCAGSAHKEMRPTAGSEEKCQLMESSPKKTKTGSDSLAGGKQ